MNVEIKKMETDEEIRGKAYVHWKSWRETYVGIVSDDYLENVHTYERCLSRVGPFGEAKIDVAKIDGEVVGFVCYGPSDEVPGAGEIHGLYLLEAYQGKRIGLSLMDHAFERLKEYDRIILWAFKDNKRALDFYEKYGFRADGEEHEYVFGKPAVGIRMVYERNRTRKQ